ncbi:Glucanosyltransferase-domain-containing protein [Mortierella sp. GBAus27b]|nr:1,3-beta-glucanosyltransferase gas1 [Mortierella sp. GBA43]KAI8346035.1 Glucanosyltransferase-domain-containing protein [Mortierella sp. GBAus27b]
MVYISVLAVLTLAASFCTRSTTAALNPIVIKGTKFFDSFTKEQFFIKGVAYQPRSDILGAFDPLSRPSECRRDVALMKDLGLNTIRVYQVDPAQNHNDCMKALEDAGIYLILDLVANSHSIIRNSPEYDINVWNSIRATIDAFKSFSNVLGFFIGNEVTNDKHTTAASAYVKALTRDAKAYIAIGSPRRIPVGYANNDDPDIRLQVQDYFNCGKDEERIDFYGINLYEWCGAGATYQSSGYADRTREIASYSIPVFLSEFGCNLVTPRPFTEVASIFGNDMTGAWSGGIAYEWTQEKNNYGLVQIQSGGSVTLLQDFHNLKAALAPLHPVGVNMDAFNEQRPISTCPIITPTWEASSILPPKPSESVCNCMMSSLSCVASEPALATTGDLGTQLNTLCGMTSCDDIATNARTGVYGKYSFCTPEQKLSYVYNHFYTNVGKQDPASCNFGGMAKLTVASRPSDDGCIALE